MCITPKGTGIPKETSSLSNIVLGAVRTLDLAHPGVLLFNFIPLYLMPLFLAQHHVTLIRFSRGK